MANDGHSTFRITGGTFDHNPSNYVAIGYEAIDNANGTWTVQSAGYAACIGNETYMTLEEAIAAVPTTGEATTVTLLKDISLESGITIDASKSVVLELNGFTLSAEVSQSSHSDLIKNNGTLVIQDNTDLAANGTGTGKITYFNSNPDPKNVPGYYSNTIVNQGNLTINSGYIENTTTGGYAAYTVDNLTNGGLYTPVFTMNGGKLYNSYTDAVRMFLNSNTKKNKVVINGGILDSDKASGRVIVMHLPSSSASYAANGELIISGGTIMGKVNAWSAANAGGVEDQFGDGQYENINIEISGGSIEALDFSAMANASLRAGSLSVTGGTYDNDPSAYVSAGYEAVGPTDGKWTVAEVANEARIGSVNYATLAEAIAAVPTNGNATTVTLLKNVSLASGITIDASKSVVLELNGFTLSAAVSVSSHSDLIKNNGTLVIQDITDGAANGTGTGKITYFNSNPDPNSTPGYYSNTIVNQGNLTINSGYIENTTYGGWAAYTVDNITNGGLYTPVFTMNGGKLYNSYTDAVRMFLNSDSKLNKVVINGGILDSDKASGRVIVMQDANAKANKGELDVTGGTIAGMISAWSSPNDTFADNQYAEISISISGGSIEKIDFQYMANTALRAGSLSVTGGTYDNDPSAFVSAGYAANDNGNGTWTVAALQGVAAIGNTGYGTLAAAIAAAEAGDTIALLQDISDAGSYQFSGISNPNYFGAVIEKSLTIDGKGHTITGPADKRPFGIAGSNINVTLKDLTIRNNGSDGPTIWACGPTTLTLDNCTVDGTNTKGAYNQPVTISNNSSLPGRFTLNVINGSVIKTNDEAMAHYDIIVWGPSDINVSNSTLKGYAAVYVKPDASGTVVTVSGSDIESHGYSGISNAFGMFVTESGNNTFTLTSNNYRITAGDQYQVLTEVSGTTGNVVKLLGTSSFTPNDPVHGTITSSWGNFSANLNSLYMDDANKELFASYIPAECTVVKETEGTYSGLWKISGPTPEVYYYWDTNSGQEGAYCKLEDPFDNGWLCDGEYIDIQKNLSLAKTIACQLTSGSFRFNLGEYSVSKGNYSITLKAGVSVVTDKATDIFSAADAGYSIAETVANNTYTYTPVADVAKIGETSYATLAEAVAAAEAGQNVTIEILRDFTIEGNAGVTIPAGKIITIDLKGKNVKNLVTADAQSQLILNNGTLTITDSSNTPGSMFNEIADGVHPGSWTDYNYSTSIIYNTGTVTVQNGTIRQVAGGGSSNICFAIDNVGANTSLTVNGGTLQSGYIPVRSYIGQNKSVAIHGGTLTGLYDIYLQSNTTLNIDGGTFNAPERNIIYVDGASTVNISGNAVFNYAASRQFIAFDSDAVQTGSNVSVTGGTFNSNPATFVAAGYEATQSGNVWTVAEMQGVAQIGQTTYASLAEAFAAVPASGATTIRMINNTNVVFEGATFVTITENQDITLDLNGYEINIAPESSWNKASQAILNNGKITFVDNSSSADGFIAFDAYPTWVYQGNYNYSNSYASNLISNRNSGRVYVESGTLKNLGGGSACYVIDSYNSAKVYINGGSIVSTKTALRQFTGTADNLLQINGGTVDAGRMGISIHTTATSSSKFEMTGGTVNGAYGIAVWCNNVNPASPELTITGGNMNAVVYVDGHFPASGITISGGHIDSFFSEDANCQCITGGTFDKNPSMATDPDNEIAGVFNHVAPGYEAVNNGDGTWTVAEIPGVAKIGTTNYASLVNAIEAVPTDGTKTTITMIGNETMAENTVINIPATKNIVLDLNGKTVSSTGGSPSASYYFISNRGTLEITDSSAGKNGKITSACTVPSPGWSKEYVTVYNIGGTLTLSAGKVETTSGGLSYAINNSSNAWGQGDDKESVFNMTGGTIYSPNGDAGLRVYQNCAQSATPYSHNIVNISGGTIAAGGIFLDNYIYNPNVNTTGSGILTNVTISGGEIHGLIDVKLRHTFNTTFNITGGTFVGSKLWVRKHSEWNSVVAEPTEPLFFISGGNFSFTQNMSFGLAYDCSGTSWTSYAEPYSITGGTFNNNPSAHVASGYEANDNGNGTWTVAEKQGVAKIGTTNYESLAAAVAAAQNGDTIELIADDDISLTSGGEIEINKPLTITGATNSNGEPKYTVYGTPTYNGNYNDIFLATASGTITISNINFSNFSDKVASSSNGRAVLFIGSNNNNAVIENVYISDINTEAVHINGGSFLIKDCAFDCANLNGGSVFTRGIQVVNHAHGSIVNTGISNTVASNSVSTAPIELLGDGTILIEDCDLSAYDETHVKSIGIAAGPCANQPGGSQVTVRNCNVTAYEALYGDGDTNALLTVESGEYAGYLVQGDNGRGITLTGGTYTVDPSSFVASGYIAMYSASTHTFTVEAAQYWEDVAVSDADFASITDETNKIITISTAAQLAKLAKNVNAHVAGTTGFIYKGYTVKLDADINLAGKIWTPIGVCEDWTRGHFTGTFDGQGHTISNLKVVREDRAGLFGSIYGEAVIKDLNVTNVTLVSNHFAGGIIGWINEENYDLVVDNCSVVGGIITVVPNYVNNEWDNGDKCGGIVGYSNQNTANHCKIINNRAQNLTITAYRDCGGVVGYCSGNVYVGNNSVNNVTLVQDNFHAYKSSVTTVNQIVGRNDGSTQENNTAESVTISTVN